VNDPAVDVSGVFLKVRVRVAVAPPEMVPVFEKLWVPSGIVTVAALSDPDHRVVASSVIVSRLLLLPDPGIQFTTILLIVRVAAPLFVILIVALVPDTVMVKSVGWQGRTAAAVKV
jgi:hypothetical protein